MEGVAQGTAQDSTGPASNSPLSLRDGAWAPGPTWAVARNPGLLTFALTVCSGVTVGRATGRLSWGHMWTACPALSAGMKREFPAKTVCKDGSTRTWGPRRPWALTHLPIRGAMDRDRTGRGAGQTAFPPPGMPTIRWQPLGLTKHLLPHAISCRRGHLSLPPSWKADDHPPNRKGSFLTLLVCGSACFLTHQVSESLLRLIFLNNLQRNALLGHTRLSKECRHYRASLNGHILQRWTQYTNVWLYY